MASNAAPSISGRRSEADLRHPLAVHLENDTPALSNTAPSRQDTALTAAAVGTLPGVAPKSRRIERFHRSGDAVVQIRQVSLHRAGIRC